MEYAASLHGVGVNDEIKNRIHALAVEVPQEVIAGQTMLDFSDCDTPEKN